MTSDVPPGGKPTHMRAILMPVCAKPCVGRPGAVRTRPAADAVNKFRRVIMDAIIRARFARPSRLPFGILPVPLLAYPATLFERVRPRTRRFGRPRTHL